MIGFWWLLAKKAMQAHQKNKQASIDAGGSQAMPQGVDMGLNNSFAAGGAVSGALADMAGGDEEGGGDGGGGGIQVSPGVARMQDAPQQLRDRLQLAYDAKPNYGKAALGGLFSRGDKIGGFQGSISRQRQGRMDDAAMGYYRDRANTPYHIRRPEY